MCERRKLNFSDVIGKWGIIPTDQIEECANLLSNASSPLDVKVGVEEVGFEGDAGQLMIPIARNLVIECKQVESLRGEIDNFITARKKDWRKKVGHLTLMPNC